MGASPALVARRARVEATSVRFTPSNEVLDRFARFVITRCIAGATALVIFTGHFGLMGFPINPARTLTFIAVFVWAARKVLIGSIVRKRRWNMGHVLLLSCAVYAIGSAFAHGSLGNASKNGLLDTFGLIPFLLFFISADTFIARRDRLFFLKVVTVVAGYLALTAVLEGLGLRALTWPRYINDPSVGYHLERARGPFAEAVGNGVAIVQFGGLALIGATQWQSRRAKRWGRFIGIASIGASVFTLTRSVWIGTAFAMLVVLASFKRLRRYLPAVAGASLVLVIALLTVVPGFSESVETRTSQQRPIWDRINMNAAAYAAFEDHPLVGLGWDGIRTQGPDYLFQNDSIPIFQESEETSIHSWYLTILADLGFIGFMLWFGSVCYWLLLAPLRPSKSRELAHWRAGLLFISIELLFVAGFVPMSQAAGSFVVWVVAGIVAAQHPMGWVRVQNRSVVA